MFCQCYDVAETRGDPALPPWRTDVLHARIERALARELKRVVVVQRGPRPALLIYPESNRSAPIYRASLDSVELTGDRMVCDIYDSGFHWRVTYAADRPLRMRCGRWSNYLRLTAFWHAGEPRVLDEAFYQQMQLHGVLELVTAPPGSLAHESSTGAAQ